MIAVALPGSPRLIYLRFDTIFPFAARDAILVGYGEVFAEDAVCSAPNRHG